MTKSVITVALGLLLLTAGFAHAQKAPPAVPPVKNPALTNTPAPPHGMSEKGYVLTSNTTLFLTFPEGWKSEIKHVVQKDKVFDAAFFAPPTGNEFNLLIEIANVGERNAQTLDTKAQLINAANKAGMSEVTNAVEKELVLHDLKGKHVTGSYFHITDKTWTKPAANPDAPDRQFKYLTRGMVTTGPLVLTFGIVNDDTKYEPDALDVVRSARFVRQ